MKWLQRKKIKPINLMPGDTLKLLNRNKGVTEELMSQDIETVLTVDEIGVFELENEQGFKRAIGGVFGESDEW